MREIFVITSDKLDEAADELYGLGLLDMSNRYADPEFIELEATEKREIVKRIIQLVTGLPVTEDHS